MAYNLVKARKKISEAGMRAVKSLNEAKSQLNFLGTMDMGSAFDGGMLVTFRNQSRVGGVQGDIDKAKFDLRKFVKTIDKNLEKDGSLLDLPEFMEKVEAVKAFSEEFFYGFQVDWLSSGSMEEGKATILKGVELVETLLDTISQGDK